MKKLISTSFAALFLLGCTAPGKPLTYDMTFARDGGGTISLPVTLGGPMPAENEKFKVTGAGTVVGIKKGDPDHSDLSWAFSVRMKSPQSIESVIVEQVTLEGKLVPVLKDQSPKLVNGSWSGASSAISMSKTDVPWLYDNATSTFLFKITLQQPGIPVTVLYQPSQLMRQVKATYLQMLAK